MIHRPEEFDTSLAPLRGDGQVKEEECFFSVLDNNRILPVCMPRRRPVRKWTDSICVDSAPMNIGIMKLLDIPGS